MRETLTIVPSHSQPERLPVSQTISSPGGRPYSPYPFRDLPRTPSSGERSPHIQQHHSHHHRRGHPTTKPAAAQHPKPNDAIFSLFSYLPTEIRLQIWREAMFSACPQRRVLRLRLAVGESTPPKPSHDANEDGPLYPNSQNTPPSHQNHCHHHHHQQQQQHSTSSRTHLQILPTRHLAFSTQPIRALLASCPEARYELLPLLLSNPASFARHASVPPSLPDTIPLWYSPDIQDTRSIESGILRCNLHTDIVVLEGLTSDLLFGLSGEEPQRGAGDGERDGRGSSALLGLEGVLAGVHHIGLDVRALLEEIAGRGAADRRAVETALIRLVSAIGQGSCSPPSEEEKGETRVRSLKEVYLLGDTAVVNESGYEERKESRGIWVPGSSDTRDGAWYTTQPPPSYYVNNNYYTHLTRLMWLMCRLREVTDAPALVVPSDDEKGLHSLGGVKLKLLGRYIARQRNEMEGGLQLSSPERCLEVALGNEPRWMQWEWVCQCLGC